MIPARNDVSAAWDWFRAPQIEHAEMTCTGADALDSALPKAMDIAHPKAAGRERVPRWPEGSAPSVLPLNAMNKMMIIMAFSDLMACSGNSEKIRAVVEQYPLLLGPGVDEVVLELDDQVKGKSQESGPQDGGSTIYNHLVFLRCCRSAGIDVAISRIKDDLDALLREYGTDDRS